MLKTRNSGLEKSHLGQIVDPVNFILFYLFIFAMQKVKAELQALCNERDQYRNEINKATYGYKKKQGTLQSQIPPLLHNIRYI